MFTTSDKKFAEITVKQWYRHKYGQALGELNKNIIVEYLEDELGEQSSDPVKARTQRDVVFRVRDILNEFYDLSIEDVKEETPLCPHCGKPLIIRKTKRGRRFICPTTGDAVSAHPGTNIPLGMPADRGTRAARARAHKAFDEMWFHMGWTRNFAYQWLAKEMGLSEEECHIGRFNKEQCNRVIELSEEWRPAWEKRAAVRRLRGIIEDSGETLELIKCERLGIKDNE